MIDIECGCSSVTQVETGESFKMNILIKLHFSR